MKRIIVVILFSILNGYYVTGQNKVRDVSITDTVMISGVLIGVTEREKLNLDQHFEFFFVTDSEYEKLNRIKYKNLIDLNQNRDSIFMVRWGAVFSDLNNMVLSRPISIISSDSLPIPSADAYYRKDRNNYYSLWKINGEFFSSNLDKSYLKYLVDLKQYHFRNSIVPFFVLNRFELKDSKNNVKVRH